MSYSTYPTHQHVGDLCLGELPLDWGFKKLKFLSEVQPSNVDKKSHEGEEPVFLCNYTDVYYNEEITLGIDFMRATASNEQIRKFGLKSGDTIITKDSEDRSDIAVPAFVPNDLPDVVCGYHLALLRPNVGLVGAFLKRVMDSKYARNEFSTRANGLTRYGLGTYALKNFKMPLPAPGEQTAIANFLDRETAKIDDLIEKQERLIKLLEEKRKAVISHAVTKGLKTDVRMKDSGVEWLGEVPEHWQVKRIKFLAGLNRSKSEVRHLNPDLEVTFLPMEAIGENGELDISNVRWLGDVIDGYTYLSEGDVIIAKITPCFENGKGAVARKLMGGIAFATTEVIPLTCGETCDCEYLYFLLYSDPFRSLAEGSMYGAGGQKRVSDSFVANYHAAIPPKEEQELIAKSIKAETSKLCGLMDKCVDAIRLAKERRIALISAAVTGKIDVRNAV